MPVSASRPNRKRAAGRGARCRNPTEGEVPGGPARARYSDLAICLYSYAPVAEATDTRAAFFRGLSDPSRLSLIEELARGDHRVTDLAALTGLSQPNVSKHLACLWDCGLVERERRGPEIHYRLVAGLDEVLASADGVLATTGERVRACPRYGRRAVRRAA